MTTEEIEPAEPDFAAPAEVGGWLLLLCLILAVVGPVRILYDVVRHGIPKLVSTHRVGSIVLACVYSALFTGVAVFSFVAGAKLWLFKSGAVRFSRHFLLAYLAAHVAYFALWLLVDWPTSSIALARMGWGHIVGPLAFVAFWYTYLQHSKRVRATYPPE
jgi:hypothetical protein